MDDLQKIDAWLEVLLANIEPATGKKMMQDPAQQLRWTQQNNIRLQHNPDGSTYEARKLTARSKKGHIKRQMSAKFRTARFPRVSSSVNSTNVAFVGQIPRIARGATTTYKTRQADGAKSTLC